MNRTPLPGSMIGTSPQTVADLSVEGGLFTAAIVDWIHQLAAHTAQQTGNGPSSRENAPREGE